MEHNNKEKEDKVAKSLGSSQNIGDHSLPPAQKSPSQENEVFKEEVEQISSLSEESLMYLGVH